MFFILYDKQDNVNYRMHTERLLWLGRIRDVWRKTDVSIQKCRCREQIAQLHICLNLTPTEDFFKGWINSMLKKVG